MENHGLLSLAVCESAVMQATEKIISQAKKIEVHILETDAGEVDFDNETFRIRDSDKTLSFGKVTLKTYIPYQILIDKIELVLEKTAFDYLVNFIHPCNV